MFPESLEIHRNERCEAVSSREWEQIHEKSASQTEGWYVELEEVYHFSIFITPEGSAEHYTRQLSYRKEDRAMRPIDGCTEKF